MKKTLLIVFAGLMLTKVNAQNFNFGLHLTPTFNYLSTNDPTAETGLDMMFGLGLLGEYKFSDNYSIASGIDIYFRRGAEMTKMDTTGEYGSGFVHIPIALKMRTREFGYFVYYGRFGADLAIETGEKVEFDPEPVPWLKSYVSPFNMVFRVGAGTEYALGGSTKLFGEITYNRSLIDNLSERNPLVEDKYNYRFDFIALSVGVIF